MNYCVPVHLFNNVFRVAVTRCIVALFLANVTFHLFFPLSTADAQDNWLEEFEEICSMVIASHSLSLDELQSLIERSDALLTRIEDSDEPSKKVYIFRLKKCRSFFQYIIELKKRDNPSDESS